MRIADIHLYDIANGPGIRVSLWTQGCRRRCRGCHNKSTWDPDDGFEFTVNHLNVLTDQLSKSYVSGLSVLGGEPLDQSEELVPLLKYLKACFPDKNVWLWTGNTYEDVKDDPVFEYVDVVVDGAFVEELKNISLQWRGSENQRVLYLKKKE